MTDRKSVPNPFENDVVIDPSVPAETDVPRIHEKAFQVCVNAYERVAAGKGAWSVLLYGDAGCGKTHLLSRFKKWLGGELESQPTVAAGLFVAVRMDTGPGRVWRHLRRRFVEELLRPGADGSPYLDAILARYASHDGGDLGKSFDSAPVRDLGHDLIQVLERFAAGKQRRLCRAWLIGDGISEADLQTLNLPQSSLESMDEDSAEYDARRVVLAITRLSAPAPVVFCFDQIEALGLSQQNKRFGAFTRMGASLIDEIETGNSLVISTILMTFLKDLEDGSHRPDFQRIARKDQADLEPLDWELGKELVGARLKLAPEVVNENPVSESELRTFYQKQHGQRVTPRLLIHEARRLFDLWKGGSGARPDPEDFLRNEYERLWSEAAVRTNVNLVDDVLSPGLPIVLDLLGRKTEQYPATSIDLAAGSGSSKVLVAFGNNSNMNSFAAWLRRLQKQSTPGAPICVVRDERLPISKTAKAVTQRLQEISQKDGRVVRVDVEALAAIDAMRVLLARATSGDLSLDGKPIEAQTVKDWLARNLPEPVRKFAGEILGEELRSQEIPPDALLELLAKRKVLPIEEAARLSELPAELIEKYARTRPDRIGWFGGVRPVVCQAITTSAQRDERGA